MRTRAAVASAILMVAGCAVAEAAKPLPEVRPADPAAVRRVGAVAHSTGAAACDAGVTGPAVFAVNYLLPPNDAYYTYVRCDLCAPDSASIPEVHVALRFPVACEQPVVVSFVAAMGDTECLEPDTLLAMSPPVSFLLTAPAPGDYDFGLTLPTPAHVRADAFLRVNFPTDGAAACTTLETRPRLLTTGSCVSCRSWNDSVAGRQDLCRVLLPGRPVMYAILGTCAVPVRKFSWGSLKLRYR